MRSILLALAFGSLSLNPAPASDCSPKCKAPEVCVYRCGSVKPFCSRNPPAQIERCGGILEFLTANGGRFTLSTTTAPAEARPQ